MRDGDRQENSGAGAILINGNNNTINQHHHQHTHHHQHDHVHNTHVHGSLHVDTLVVHQDAPFALQAPPAPPARNRGRREMDRPELTPAQRECLALMRPLPRPERIAVLDWMRCEFGTALVMDLDPRELLRLRMHLADVRRSGGRAVGDVTTF